MTDQPVRAMKLRYAGTCVCGTAIAAGAQAGYDAAAKRAVCPECLPGRLAPPPSAPASAADSYFAPPVERVESGTAGGSAKARFEHLSKRREDRMRAKHPRLGGLLLALSGDPQSTLAWAAGAHGEMRVGAKLKELEGDGVLALHDRRIPGTRSNIDHIAVGPSGVFVIDAKRYANADVEIRRSGGFLSERVEGLYIRGRNQTKLVVAMARQVDVVMEALETDRGLDGVTVTPVLTFIDANIPVIGTMEIAGVPVLNLRKTAKLVRREGPLSVAMRQRIHRVLAEVLPAYNADG
ncbi:MAG TPA: nuclease-related domain-containing protein [Aeromicrobium sp.]|nr:nuclease-related domain-containing protein [Aeromicrobium sp.]